METDNKSHPFIKAFAKYRTNQIRRYLRLQDAAKVCMVEQRIYQSNKDTYIYWEKLRHTEPQTYGNEFLGALIHIDKDPYAGIDCLTKSRVLKPLDKWHKLQSMCHKQARAEWESFFIKHRHEFLLRLKPVYKKQIEELWPNLPPKQYPEPPAAGQDLSVDFARLSAKVLEIAQEAHKDS